MQKSLRPRSTAFWFGIAVGLLVWVSLASFWMTHQLIDTFDSVAQVHQALAKSQHMEVLMEAAETGVYGFVMTGDTARLESLRYAKLMIPYELRQIQALLTMNPEKRKPFKTLEGLLNHHLNYLSNVAAVRKSQGYDAAAGMITDRAATATHDPMERLLSQIQQEEQTQLHHRWGRASTHALTTKALWFLSTLVTLALLGWVFNMLRRETKDRRLAENTTQTTETFLHSIIERIPFMITVKEAVNLRYTLANKASEDWLGKKREELVDSNDLDLRPKDEARASIQRDREALAGGKLIDMEETLVLPNKEEKVIRTQKIPVPDSAGNPAYLLTISEDITQRKQAERMLELSRDAAMEASRLRSEFIRNMSHEFRTPLSIVIGMTSLILDSELTDEQRKFADTVKRAAAGLSQLTKSILDFSKIEAGTFALENRELNIRRIIDDVVGMHQAQVKAKGVSLTSLVAENLPSAVRGDPVRLSQVLTQLLGNAVKFTEKGEIIVRVSETKETDSQLWLECRITDTGIGIPEDIQKHLFEAFRQGDGSHTRRYGGTGLGLAISKRIVELMGGTVGFESAPGSGSTFWFTIPLDKRHVRGPAVHVPSLPWTKSRVMVLSDNVTYRQLIQQQLSGWALSSETVSSGEAALDLLRREKKAGRAFPIVLLDMHLSDMESIDFARAVKNDKALAATKLVVMTGKDAALDAAASASLGFSGNLPMPPEPEELYHCLASIIDPNQPTQRQHAA